MNPPFDSPFTEENAGIFDEEQPFGSFDDEYGVPEDQDEILFDGEQPFGSLDDEYGVPEDQDEILFDGESDFENINESESLADEWGGSDIVESEVVREAEVEYVPQHFEDGEHMVEQEVYAGTNRMKSIRMPAAEPPCRPASPASGTQPGSNAGSGARVPDYRPGAGRVRRRASRPYVKWVQRALNQILGTALATDGLWGRRTSAALRQFQRTAGISADGKLGPQTEGALRKFTNTEPPQREAEFENIAPAVAISGAGLALNFVKFGFDTIAKITAGDLTFRGPRQAVGIRTTNIPSHFNPKVKQKSLLIINFVEDGPLDLSRVNVKLRCKVQYDGMNLDVRFSFDPQGRRSRLGRDTVVKIGDPMSLERGQAPVVWQRCGVPDYRILRIPISYTVDRPWPLDNYNENFELVLSSMYGFGATASGSGRKHIQNQRVAWN